MTSQTLTGVAPESGAALADIAGLPHGWVILSNRVLSGAGEPAISVSYVLLHPEIGIALLDVAPASALAPARPEAVQRMQRMLDSAQFRAIFGRYPPIVHCSVSPEELHSLRRELDQAFKAEPPLNLPGGQSWMGSALRLLSTRGEPELPVTVRPMAGRSAHSTTGPEPALQQGRAGRGWGARLALGGAVAAGVLVVLAGLHMMNDGAEGTAAFPPGPDRAPAVLGEAPPAAPQAATPAPAVAVAPGPRTTSAPPEPAPAPPSAPTVAAAPPAPDPVPPEQAPSPAPDHPPALAAAPAPPPAAVPDMPEEAPPAAMAEVVPKFVEPVPGSKPAAPEAGRAPAPTEPLQEPPPPAAARPSPAVAPTVPAEPPRANPPEAAAPPPPAPAAHPGQAQQLSPGMVAALLRRGEEMRDLGDLSAARALLTRAAEAGSARAAAALASTWDPARLPPAQAGAADPVRALEWYRRAARGGDAEAARAVTRLEAGVR